MERCQLSIKHKLHIGNKSIYSTEVSKSNLCNYSDAYILVRDDITIAGDMELK